jgi:hypothetical protein
MSREEIVAVLGQPDDVGVTSRKYRTPAIYKYGEIELHFESWKSGKLIRAYTEDESGVGKVLLK